MQVGTAKRTEDHPPDRARLEEYLSGIAAGDREALGALYEAARGAVYAAALGVLRNAPDAQDVTQDTFVRVWECAGSYRPQGAPMAWILTIARNLALMRLRRESRTQPLSQPEREAAPDRDPGLEAEDRAVLAGALNALADEERQIVLLHAAAGLRHREIGRALDMPLGTVLSKYRRALKKLRTHLEGDDAL